MDGGSGAAVSASLCASQDPGIAQLQKACAAAGANATVPEEASRTKDFCQRHFAARTHNIRQSPAVEPSQDSILAETKKD
jgi:hypothetical protein